MVQEEKDRVALAQIIMSSNPSRNLSNRRGFRASNRNRSGRNYYGQPRLRGNLHSQHNLFDPWNIQPSGNRGYARRQDVNRIEKSSRCKFLEQVLSHSNSPEDIILKLLSKKSGFNLIVQDPDLSSQTDEIILSIKVICKASITLISRENWMELTKTSFCQTFKNSLVTFISIKISSVDAEVLVASIYSDFFKSLFTIIDKFYEIRPFMAVELFYDILQASAMVLDSKQVPTKIFRECNSWKDKLENTKMQFSTKQKTKNTWLRDDDNDPPDNFREMSIFPTAQDISMNEFPFLRRNVIEGRYKDDNHYLDVQFRLLREDFVRPLRLGVTEHIKCIDTDTRNRNRDISVYTKVTVKSYEIVNNQYAYLIHINFPKSFNIENSRRLMYGNLVCFSDDNFKTLHFGYIFDRSMETLKKGQIYVKFETNPITLGKEYVMAESKAYFVAFKHVLEALQKIQKVPLSHYLLYVSHDLCNPDYLSQDLHYDLIALRSEKMLCKRNNGFSIVYKYPKPNSSCPELSNVLVLAPLLVWPTASSLGLDDSQRKALHGALTQQLAIIQGPPGTGKTFLGLKITQILLHNRNKWVDPSEKSPILVVCYTNHALDQFLEGMLAFTLNIVRVGSRSKNEALMDFQIKNLLWEKKITGAMPILMHDRSCELEKKVKDSDSKLSCANAEAKELRNPDGIFSLSVLKLVIPDYIYQELLNIGLTNWLMLTSNEELVEDDYPESDIAQESSVTDVWKDGHKEEFVEDDYPESDMAQESSVTDVWKDGHKEEFVEDDYPESDIAQKSSVTDVWKDGHKEEFVEDDYPESDIAQESSVTDVWKDGHKEEFVEDDYPESDIAQKSSVTDVWKDGHKEEFVEDDYPESDIAQESSVTDVWKDGHKEEFVEDDYPESDIAQKSSVTDVWKDGHKEEFVEDDYPESDIAQESSVTDVWKDGHKEEFVEDDYPESDIAQESSVTDVWKDGHKEEMQENSDVDTMKKVIQENINEDALKDIQEFIAEEEANRFIDIDVDVTYNDRKVNLEDMYETRLSDLENEMNELAPYAQEAMWFFNNEDLEYYNMHENMHYYYLHENKKLFYKDVLRGMQVAKNLKSAKTSEMNDLMKHAEIFGIESFTFEQRWLLYQSWIDQHLKNVIKNISFLAQEYMHNCSAQDELRDQQHFFIMQSSDVVGMTTTGAARYHDVLKALKCQIVIIEEAAEILESHVVTSLSDKCEHLIMIGDHQQLRPSTTVYELATKYNLETSLFERMVKNGVTFNTLEYQHRMRPEISQLLVPAIYPGLKDNPTVYGRQNINGIDKNLFFIDHKIHENNKQDSTSTSHENTFEASFLMALCNHLLLQGYNADQITILTPYMGQYFLLKKEQHCYKLCSDVKICVVDNFQGEESDIILLSLVRSNEQSNVGFLKVDNRVNVALSRAKNGMYIMGNMDQLCSKSKLWVNIKETLEAQNSIGSFLPLRCVNHPDVLTKATNAEVFKKSSPNGGCNLPCPYKFPDCGHPCKRICHARNMYHLDARCLFLCLRKQCDNDAHLCMKKCFEDCGPCIRIEDKYLDCGHVVKDKCHLTPDEINCHVLVERPLTHCLHLNKMECYQSVDTFACTYDCETRLDCGHKCINRCHATKDPDHLEYKCIEDCAELNKGCVENHVCRKKCYEDCGLCRHQVTKKLPCGHESKNAYCHLDPETIQCTKRCSKILACSHKCRKLCNENCGDCKVVLSKHVQSCGHEIKIECRKEAKSNFCIRKCPKMLPCGHPCKNRCKEICTQDCKYISASKFQCPKGHTVQLPCYQVNFITEEEAQLHCKEACDSTLLCGHNCKGKCGECLFGRIHKPCQEKCGKTLICGHKCKSVCSFECPPCQEMCEIKCSHSKCKKLCGIPCTPCDMECSNTCKHKKEEKCVMKCGEPCSTIKNRSSWTPCVQPCPKTIRKCGHDCIGFCGDPCPKQCRICDQQELTESILMGIENKPNSRFVLLPDCNHAIEVEGLEHWLNTDNEEIGMKKCPRCQNPIYNLKRYSNIILRSYKNVEAVKLQYFTNKSINAEIEDTIAFLRTIKNCPLVMPLKHLISRNLGLEFTISETKRMKICSNDDLLTLADFQAITLKRLSDILRFSRAKSVVLASAFLINVLMNVKNSISYQTASDITSEVHRIAILPYIEKLKKVSYSDEMKKCIERCMDPTLPFTVEREEDVIKILKETLKSDRKLNLLTSERRIMIAAKGLNQSQWHKCQRGHVYSITECNGTIACPECNNKSHGAVEPKAGRLTYQPRHKRSLKFHNRPSRHFAKY